MVSELDWGLCTPLDTSMYVCLESTACGYNIQTMFITTLTMNCTVVAFRIVTFQCIVPVVPEVSSPVTYSTVAYRIRLLLIARN